VTGADSEQTTGEEIDLVRRAIRGDGDAFGVLYGRYLDAIYRYIFFRIHDHHDAEDLSEETFIRAWENLPRYQIRKVRFSAWLYRIAHNVTVDYLRKRRPAPITDEALSLIPAAGPSLEGIVQHDEDVGRLIESLEVLTEEEQTVIILRFVEGRSHREVAEVIDKSEGSCRVVQHRALSKLAEALGKP
jgi:RNA polymerase sigma-70 factor (ECF subfamily)